MKATKLVTYFGGWSWASRNSTILGGSVTTSLSKRINGVEVPGAISASSFGLLKYSIRNRFPSFWLWIIVVPRVRETHLSLSTVVTLNTDPLSQSIMNRPCEKGQHPMHSRSLPAFTFQWIRNAVRFTQTVTRVKPNTVRSSSVNLTKVRFWQWINTKTRPSPRSSTRQKPFFQYPFQKAQFDVPAPLVPTSLNFLFLCLFFFEKSDFFLNKFVFFLWLFSENE